MTYAGLVSTLYTNVSLQTENVRTDSGTLLVQNPSTTRSLLLSVYPLWALGLLPTLVWVYLGQTQ